MPASRRGELPPAAADSPLLVLASGAVLGVGYGAVLWPAQAAAVRSAPLTRAGLPTSTYFLCTAAVVVALGLVYYAAVPGARARRATG